MAFLPLFRLFLFFLRREIGPGRKEEEEELHKLPSDDGRGTCVSPPPPLSPPAAAEKKGQNCAAAAPSLANGLYLQRRGRGGKEIQRGKLVEERRVCVENAARDSPISDLLQEIESNPGKISAERPPPPPLDFWMLPPPPPPSSISCLLLFLAFCFLLAFLPPAAKAEDSTFGGKIKKDIFQKGTKRHVCMTDFSAFTHSIYSKEKSKSHRENSHSTAERN